MSDRPVVAELTGDELGEWADMRDLQRKARTWYMDNLQGKSVTNKETGWSIRFTRGASGKIGGKPLDYLLRAVPALSEIVDKARHVGKPEMDRRGRQGVKAIHRFESDVLIGGTRETINIVIREMSDGRHFYDLNLGEFVGARTSDDPMGARESRVEPEEQLSADTLNIAFAGPEINGVPASSLRDIGALVGKILDAHGLGAKISPRVVRGLLSSSGVPVLGSYVDGTMKVNAQAADPAHVVRHEIIHALRDARLWGAPHERAVYNATIDVVDRLATALDMDASALLERRTNDGPDA